MTGFSASDARPILIVGAGGHGRVVADIARCANEPIMGFVDDQPGPGVIATLDQALARPFDHLRFIVAIGSGPTRRRLAEEILVRGGTLATLTHPSAIIASDVVIGAGTVVMARAVINPGVRVGRFSVVNTGAILDHDNLVEDNVHISPGCTFAGAVICRHDVFIGVGACIIPRVTVGAGAYVAAGAVVIRDVSAGVLVAGCPAVVKRRLSQADSSR